METSATLTASGPRHRRQGESKKTANVIHAIVGTATSQKIDQTSLTRSGILPALDEAVTRATARSVLREPGSCQDRVAWEHARTNLQAARLQAGLLVRGATLPELKDLLGHSSLAMAMRYAHLSPEHLRSAVARLDTVLTPQKITQAITTHEPAIETTKGSR